ncbi:rod shape-determining protein MreD [Alicyclobacillus sp. SO9]|nr:rod shape-determining protein MreD [Alicyclobacillus sp. SO9]
MRNIIAFLLLWLGLVIESSLFQIPPLDTIQPNLVLIILMVVSVTRGPRTALVLGVLIGLVQDVDFGSFIGIDAFTYGFIAYFAATVLSQFLQRNIAITFLFTVVFTFVQEWMTFGFTRLFDITGFAWNTAMTQTVWQMMVNGVFLLLLYPLLTKLLVPPEKRSYASSHEDMM